MSLLSVILNLLVPMDSAADYYAYRTVSFVLIVLMLVAAIAAIILVLLLPGNSQGIDALGGSSETFFGKNKGKSNESRLKKWTFVCLGVLAVLAIVFFVIQILWV